MILSFTTRLMALPDTYSSVRYNNGNHVKVQSLRHLSPYTSCLFWISWHRCGYFNLWRSYCLALGHSRTCKQMVGPHEMASVLYTKNASYISTIKVRIKWVLQECCKSWTERGRTCYCCVLKHKFHSWQKHPSVSVVSLLIFGAFKRLIKCDLFSIIHILIKWNRKPSIFHSLINWNRNLRLKFAFRIESTVIIVDWPLMNQENLKTYIYIYIYIYI
jgi:hypothetical protein